MPRSEYAPAAVRELVLACGRSNRLSTAGGGYVAVEMVFIQFAGFTFGKSASAYATPWNGYPGNNNSFLMGGADYVTGVNNIQYTAQFGNGVSGTIGLDDGLVYNRTWSRTPVAPGCRAAFEAKPERPQPTLNATLGGSNVYAGVRAPDVVGNIRVDQAWGLFQISGMAHLVNASYNILGAGGVPTALSEISGHPEDKWGGAVMASLQIKNLPTGAGVSSSAALEVAVLRAMRAQSMEFSELNVEYGYTYESAAVVPDDRQILNGASPPAASGSSDRDPGSLRPGTRASDGWRRQWKSPRPPSKPKPTRPRSFDSST